MVYARLMVCDLMVYVRLMVCDLMTVYVRLMVFDDGVCETIVCVT